MSQKEAHQDYLDKLIRESTEIIRDSLAVARKGSLSTETDPNDERLLKILSEINARLTVVERTLSEHPLLTLSALEGDILRVGNTISAPDILSSDKLSDATHIGGGIYGRWIEADSKVTFVLPIDRMQSCELAIRVGAVSKGLNIGNARIFINGKPVKHIARHYYGGESLIVFLPATYSISATELTIGVPQISSPRDQESATSIGAVAITSLQLHTIPTFARRISRWLHLPLLFSRLMRIKN